MKQKFNKSNSYPNRTFDRILANYLNRIYDAPITPTPPARS